MAVEGNTETTESQDIGSSDSYTFEFDWHIRLDGYWEDVNREYYGDHTPNSSPLMAVPEKLAADIKIIQDDEVIQQLSDWIYDDDESIYSEVLKLTFNDFSTWHIPLRPWDKDYARIREGAVKKYVPQVIKWEAIVRGENPKEALEQYEFPWEDTKPDWFNDFEHFEFDEETRKWYNENVDWLPYIDKTIKSDDANIDIDTGDNDNWEDDW